MKFHVKIKSIDRMTRLTDHFVLDNLDSDEVNLLLLKSGQKSIEERIRQNSLFARWSNCHYEGMIPKCFEHREEIKKVICSRLRFMMIRWNDRQTDDISFDAVRCKHFDLLIKRYLVIQNNDSRYPDETIERPKRNGRPKVWLKLAIKNLNMAEKKSVSQNESDEKLKLNVFTKMCLPTQLWPRQYAIRRKIRKTAVERKKATRAKRNWTRWLPVTHKPWPDWVSKGSNFHTITPFHQNRSL